jgi:hypothetical protein
MHRIQGTNADLLIDGKGLACVSVDGDLGKQLGNFLVGKRLASG